MGQSSGALNAQCTSTHLPGGPDQELSGDHAQRHGVVADRVVVGAGRGLLNYTARGLRRDRDAQLLVGGTVIATFRPGTPGDWTASARMPAGTPTGQTQVVLRQEGTEDATATVQVT